MHAWIATVLMGKGEKMKSNYMILEIPEDLAKLWFRGVGAEIVVHCKDCTHYHKIEKRVWPTACDLFNFNVDEDDFCSRGLKK